MSGRLINSQTIRYFVSSPANDGMSGDSFEIGCPGYVEHFLKMARENARFAPISTIDIVYERIDEL